MEVWEEHTEVYHYTTLPGLKGILESQTLHATHFMYMNDPTEMEQLLPKIEEKVLPHARKYYQARSVHQGMKDHLKANGGLDAVAERRAKKLVTTVYRITLGLDGGTRFFQPYVASFCGHKSNYEQKNGLLSQWRAYGRDSGYAIVFDTKKLWELVRNEAQIYCYDFTSMGDVIYDDVDDVTFAKEFKELIAALNEDVPKLINGTEGPYTALNKQFLANLPRFKHRGFAEESEVRIVVSPTDSEGLEMMKGSDEFEKHKHSTEARLLRM